MRNKITVVSIWIFLILYSIVVINFSDWYSNYFLVGVNFGLAIAITIKKCRDLK